MSIVVGILAAAVLLLTLLVAGLLRSHADILRRLHQLDGGAEPDRHEPDRERPDRPAAEPLPRPTRTEAGRRAHDLVGTDPAGNAVSARVAGTAHDTVIAFLSSGCRTCHGFWDALRAADLPGGARTVIVTKGERDESPVAVAELAPPDVTVIMSSEAWSDYGVPGSPYLVHVEGGSGRIRGEGTAADWEAARRMLLEADGDLRQRGGGKASADARREAEVDTMLLRAGIGPDDPSLHPGREPERS